MKKLGDLFEDYCKVGEFQIVRVLNLNTFFAVMSAGEEGKEITMVRFLGSKLLKKLKNNELTSADLIGEFYDWSTLQEAEERYSKSDINDIIKSAEAKGYVWKENSKTEEPVKDEKIEEPVKSEKTEGNKIKNMVKRIKRNMGMDR